MSTLGTATVPESFVPEAQRRMLELASKFSRRSLPTPHLVIGEATDVLVCENPWHKHDDDCPVARYVTIDIVGDAPKFSGWSLVATITPMDVGFTIGTVPGEVVPAQYRDTDPYRCDHCGISRNRNKTYILRHEDGRTMQAGSTCIRDFLGWDVSNVLSYYSISADILSDDEGSGGYSGYVDPTVPFAHIVKVAASVVSVDGFYVKARDLDEGRCPTAWTVRELAFPPKNAQENQTFVRLWKKYSGQEARAERLVEATLAAINEAMQSDKDLSDWMWNIVAVARNGKVNYKNTPLVTSAIMLGVRALEQEVERKTTLPSEYVGNIGERITVQVNVLDQKFIDNDWGGTYLITMRQVGTGNIIKWFASNPQVDDDTSDEAVFTLVGTVKNHEDWKGHRQTLVTRCKVKE